MEAIKINEYGDESVLKYEEVKKPAPIAQIAELAGNGTLKTHVEKVFPFSKIAEAHKLSKEGHARGKIVLEL